MSRDISTWIVGIDEVGRGPLAGPVTVCVLACEEKTYEKLKRSKQLPVFSKDSKKLSPQARKMYALYLRSLMSKMPFDIPQAVENTRWNLVFQVVHISNKIIDAKGISFAIKKAMADGLRKLKLDPKVCDVRLDGSLKAPKKFIKQKTIVKGDEKEKIIAWASILAKVSRDSLMCRLAKKHPRYGFDVHKGYGTAKHRRAIQNYGLSVIHRKTFCKNRLV